MSEVRTVIRFHVRPDREADFESAFRRSGMLTRPIEIEGFLGAEMSRSFDERTEYLVIARWTSRDAYLEWQQHSLADAPPDALDELFDTLVDSRPGAMFEILERVLNP